MLLRRLACLLLLGLAAWATAQTDGFEFAADGIQSRFPAADRLRFLLPAKQLGAVQESPLGRVFGLGGGPLAPSKIRASLVGGSVDLYFAKGLAFKMRSAGAPYLSWKEGSVRNGVPTPDLPWILLSFADPQPPIALGFSGQRASLEVQGGPGDWTIVCPSFRGWVRLFLPVALGAEDANTAASLGALYDKCAAASEAWTALAPALPKVAIGSDAQGVTARWTFDSPGAWAPSALSLAPAGGYGIKVRSSLWKLPGMLESGPNVRVKGRELVVRFPVRLVPPGRALGTGRRAPRLASTDPVAAYCERGLSLFYSPDPSADRDALGMEVQSGSQDLDLLGARGLFDQARLTAEGTGNTSPLLLNLLSRTHWDTWQLAGDPARARRASAIAALAAALCPEDRVRLKAGILQAGIAAEAGLRAWEAQNHLTLSPVALSEPLLGVRQGLFALPGKAAEGRNLADLLLSPWRVIGQDEVLLVPESKGYGMTWPTSRLSGRLLLSGPLFQLEPVLNLTELEYRAGAVEFRARVGGPCQARLIPMKGAPAIVPWDDSPLYTESKS